MKKPAPKAAPAETGSAKKKPVPVAAQDARNAAEESYLRQLEEENRRLKMAVADLTLRNQALKLVVSKKW